MNKWIEYLKNNDFISVKKYIRDGADINEVNENGESVLACAIRCRCDLDLLMLLIENDADLYDFDDEGVSIFDMSITYNNIDMVQYIIKKGIDVNQTNRRSRFTPLMCAASYGREEIVKILLAHGADKNKTEEKGFTATDFARKMHKKSVLVILEFDENDPANKSYTR
ncbi:MAG: ankyrin repeat domain-containing protein [Campylobacterota bacterium]|nr:ankyrin repeat domain-containing protein [Campylobacterota bacterium]